MVAAVALTSISMREIGARVQSFEARKEKQRVRLTPTEAGKIRYVFCDWNADAGLASSSSAAQLESLAASPHLLGLVHSDEAGERRIQAAVEAQWTAFHRGWARDPINKTMAVHASAASYRARELAPAERFAGKSLDFNYGAYVPMHRTDWGEGMHRAWRALRLMADVDSHSLTILYALYGDRPPGLVSEVLWPDAVNREYVRVVRYVPESGGTGLTLEAMVRIDKRKRDGESADAFKLRVASAKAVRVSLLERLGKECEELIEKATEAYRKAWSLV